MANHPQYNSFCTSGLGLHSLLVAVGRSHGALGRHVAVLGAGAANDIASDFDVVVLKLLLG